MVQYVNSAVAFIALALYIDTRTQNVDEIAKRVAL